MKRWLAGLTAVFLLGTAVLGTAGCTVQVKADNLMEGIQAGEVAGKEADDGFIQAYSDFAVRLFQKTAAPEENSLISPLSVMLALAMTANGADGQTLTEMEGLLGGGLPIEELNQYLYTYVQNLSSEKDAKFQAANSIWFRDDERLQVESDFLQTNADYYGAAAYKSPFDQQTVEDINHWVEDHTDGMIKEMVREISDDAVIYLINALVFDAEWETIYKEHEISEGTFTTVKGDQRTVERMHSDESFYLDDGQATGFMKNYKGGRYSFAALLPNEGVSIGEYIASLTGERLTQTIREAEETAVEVNLPKFSYEYMVEMNGALAELGMPTAFDDDAADLSRMGHSTEGNLFIGEVLHKTFIAVDEKGTKAGAATQVVVYDSASIIDHQVNLDRPFVYMIVDNATGMPLFVGAVMDIGE